MQPVLVIDLTEDPALAFIVDAAGSDVAVLERASAPLADFLEYYLPRGAPEPNEETAAEGGEPGQDTGPPLAPALRTLIGSLSRSWTSSVVLLPPVDYVSVTLQAPFGDDERLGKILSLEVQDALPFELDDMHMHYSVGPRSGEGGYEIHVSLMPRQFLRDLLNAFREVGVDPTVLTTLSSVLNLVFGGVETAAPGAALLYCSFPQVVLGLFINGRIRVDRVLHEQLDDEETLGPSAFLRAALQESRATVRSFEQRNNVELEQILVLGSGEDLQLIQEMFPDREIRQCRLDGETTSARELLLKKAAQFGRDVKPPVPLVNFRTGEFSVGIHWKDMFKGIRAVLPYAAAALFCLILGLSASYYSRESRLATLRGTTVEHIRNLIPSIDPATERPSDFVRNEIALIQKQLRDLGSPFQLSPLDALLEISKDFQKRSGSTISRINIVGNRITLDGTAPNYTTLETIEKAFRKKKRTYCDVKNDAASSGPASTGALRFSFKVELCE